MSSLRSTIKILRIFASIFGLLLMAGNGVSADNLVKSAQISLNYLGYDAGAADNAYGKRTKRALEQFYRDIGGEFDGELDIIELLQLQKHVVDADKTAATFGKNGSWHFIFPDRENVAFQSLCKQPDFMTCDSTKWRKRLSSQIVFVSSAPSEKDVYYYEVRTLDGKTFFTNTLGILEKNGPSVMFGRKLEELEALISLDNTKIHPESNIYYKIVAANIDYVTEYPIELSNGVQLQIHDLQNFSYFMSLISPRYDDALVADYPHLKFKYDDFEERMFVSTKSYSSPLDAWFVVKDGRTNLYLRLEYSASDWLFVDRAVAKSSQKKFSVDGDFEREVSSGIREWKSFPASNVHKEFLENIAVSEKVTIRFYGRNYYGDRILEDEHLKQLGAIKRLYNHLTN